MPLQPSLAALPRGGRRPGGGQDFHVATFPAWNGKELTTMCESSGRNGTPITGIFYDPFAPAKTSESEPFRNRVRSRRQQQGRRDAEGTLQSRQQARAAAIAQVARDLQRLMDDLQ
jgi:hypothetical protein